MWLLILGFTLPKGIGYSIRGNTLDVTKCMLFLAVLATVWAELPGMLRVKAHSLYVWLMVAACLVFSGTWLSNTQYLFFAYYILMYVSALWVAAFLFRDSAFYARFTNGLALALIISGATALLDHYFHIIPFQYLRPENESFVWEYSRGQLFSENSVAFYKGFDSVPPWFAMDRFIWLSWGVLAYLHHLKNKASGLNPNLLMAVTVLGVFEVIATQARVMTVAAILVFLALLAVILLRRRSKKLNAIFVAGFVAAAAFVFRDYTMMILKNIYTVFHFIQIDSLQTGLVYSVDADKRGRILLELLPRMSDLHAYLPAGPLFYTFTYSFLGIPTDLWDDLTPLVTSMFEVGPVAWVMMIFLMLYAAAHRKDAIGKGLVPMLAAVCISVIPVSSPRFYYHIFFSLGAIFARGDHWGRART